MFDQDYQPRPIDKASLVEYTSFGSVSVTVASISLMIENVIIDGNASIRKAKRILTASDDERWRQEQVSGSVGIGEGRDSGRPHYSSLWRHRRRLCTQRNPGNEGLNE